MVMSFGWWAAPLAALPAVNPGAGDGRRLVREGFTSVVVTPAARFEVDRRTGSGGGAFSEKWDNPHAGFPRLCAEPGDLPAEYDATPPTSGHHQHGGHTPDKAYQIQICQYEALDIFRGLAEQYNISRWAASAGSLIGAQCYSSMNPWDDDIDVVVSNQHIKAFDALWASAAPGEPQFHHDHNWEQRFLLNRTTLFYKRVGSSIFKLMPTALKAGPLGMSGDLGGLDVYVDRHDSALTHSGFQTYLDGNEVLSDHVFGPTRIQHMPEGIVAAYVRSRGWTHIQHPDGAVKRRRADCMALMEG